MNCEKLGKTCVGPDCEGCDEAKPKSATSDLLPCPTDTERLDYLDALNKKLNDHYGNKCGWRLDMNFDRVRLTDSNIPPLTIREAIDEAIRRAR